MTMINISYFCLFVVCDQHGWTALHHAAVNGNTEIVKSLLLAGADVGVETLVSFTLNS